MSITISAPVSSSSNTFRYETENGDCYEFKLENVNGINVGKKKLISTPTPTPTPTPTKTPTPTPTKTLTNPSEDSMWDENNSNWSDADQNWKE